ncbi:MAG: acyl carrier protein [Bryobacteraceae bacterium]
MTRKEFLVQFDELLELPTGTLTGIEKLEDLEDWDSLAMISFMGMVDEHCQIKLSPRQFVNCETVNDLLDLTKLPAV